jgi:5-methylcytosine-specific restriction endonuclease McrA
LTRYQIPLTRKVWKRKYGGGLWDADHILPVSLGGGLCGLDNMRTLCIPCHKEVTRVLRSSKKMLVLSATKKPESRVASDC